MRTFARLPHFILLAALAAGLAGAPARAAPEPPLRQYTPQEQAGQMIQNLGDDTIKILADKNVAREQKVTMFYNMYLSTFDLQEAGKLVLGPSWNAITLEQKQEFLKLFEKLMFGFYVKWLSSYNGEKFHVIGIEPESQTVFNVSSDVIYTTGKTPVRVVWRVGQNGGRPAVSDVTVNGVSQIATQHAAYAPIVQYEGIYSLLDVMRGQLQVLYPPPTQPQPQQQ